ncbi:hypothetical protein AOZ07_11415 [Glutamicibacter halophytocola]|uniref:helix-turn-helix domain-containing protein n=1 Tax=Glutamicibacter halophytocola TaxID=1933880 RepID=UPI0006D4B04F|nr:helix-turn-helix transcriptional regulator [Glutamicibacter halophytocola]ALG29526.1 hypothetical protein AOZ07_11415 [Glutamicibacter halophytocola]
MPASISQVFAQRLREERARAGLTQAELAARLSDALGVAVYASAITRAEKGERTVRLEEAVAMAQVLGVELSSMLVGSSELERVLAEHRTALIAAQARFEEVRAEMTRLSIIVDHLEEQRAAGQEHPEMPTIMRYSSQHPE